MRLRAVVLVAIAMLGVISCSNQKKVGSAIDIKKLSERSEVLGKVKKTEKKGGGGAGFVGQQEQQQAQEQVAKEQEEEQNQQIEAQKKASAVAVSITASGFDPYYIRVFVGGVVSVTNRDSKPRSATADRGEFDSGRLAPGEAWRYEPKAPGKFNFHDSTRPYVVGTLEVIAQ
jgi:plastocyanin